jgi:hypothetical protein
MKRILIALVLAAQAFAAIPTLMQWDVRTGGDDANSCGFYTTPGTGTNRAMQDAAHVDVDGVTIQATTGGASSTVTLAGYTVLAGDVNNTFKVTSGTNTTAGTYHISSVDTGANTWTLDRAITSGASSDMVGKMGGSCVEWTAPIQGTAATFIAGNVVNVQSGTYTLAATYSLPTFGPVSIVFRGYQTAWGDYGARPEITSATNSVQLFTIGNNVQTIVFDFIEFTHTAGTRGNAIGTTGSFWIPNVVIKRSIFDGLNVAILSTSDPLIRNLQVSDTIIRNSVSHGISLSDVANLSLIDSWVYDNGADGVQHNVGSGGLYFVLCLRSALTGNGADGMDLQVANGSATVSVDRCAFAGNTNDGMDLAGGTGQSAEITNSVFFGNGDYGITYSGGGLGLANTRRKANAYGDNSAGNVDEAGSAVTLDATEFTITVDPFTDYVNGNFALNSTAGGGSALKGTGWPGTITLGTGENADVGPLQTSGGDGAGGASAYVQ